MTKQIILTIFRIYEVHAISTHLATKETIDLIQYSLSGLIEFRHFS